MAVVATVGTIAGITAATVMVGKALWSMIPDGELQEDIYEAQKKADRGLSKAEEMELSALIAAGDASKTKANLNLMQESMAGSGMVSGSDAIMSQKVAGEIDRKAAQQRGQTIQRADEAAKDRGQDELERLSAQKDKAIADRNRNIEQAALQVGQLASDEYAKSQTENVYGDKDYAASKQTSMQVDAPSGIDGLGNMNLQVPEGMGMIQQTIPPQYIDQYQTLLALGLSPEEAAKKIYGIKP
tara:strand:+ start:2332 stop:3057 length:726 start_codon:yes stop_codon:yes gene_type:complete